MPTAPPANPSSSGPVGTPRKRFFAERRLRLFPLGETLRGYSLGKLRADAGAGVNVALLAIPQGMACAMIAGLPVEAVGIVCAAAGLLLGPLFSHSRHTCLGPTNATALMIFSSIAGFASADRPGFLAVMTLMAALLLLTAAALRMADLIQYVSRSVITGYISGAALVIMAAQLPEALGIPRSDLPSGVRTFFTLIVATVRSLAHVSGPDVAIAALTIGTHTLLARLPWTRRLPVFALTLVLMTGVAALLAARGVHVATLDSFSLRELTPGFPDLGDIRTLDAIGALTGPAFALAFLAALESSVMAKSLAGKSGDRPDLNQDLFGCGVGNLGAAFFGGMPVSASPTRSALNFASGARTGMASFIAGVLCLGGALALGPWVHLVPRAALSALVICVTTALLQRRNIRVCLRATKNDAITLVVTFVCTLLMPLYVAIFAGVAVSVLLYLRQASRPSLVEYEFTPEGALTEKEAARDRQNPAISIVHVEGELFFGAAELFRKQIQLTAADENLRVIILRMKNARHLDATSVMALEELVEFMRANDRHVIISGLSKEVYRVLRNSEMIPVIGRENLFIGSAQNPNLSTRNALKRAQALLGTAKADVRIFYDPAKA